MKVVVFDKNTKEILSIVSTEDESICRNDIDFAVFSEDTEPILTDINGKVYFNENKIMVNVCETNTQ